jgi:uncharacterized membrane protein YccC
MALGAYGLWPTRERQLIRPSLARLLRAYADYVASLGAASPYELREARNAVRVARANAEAALARLRTEPRTSPAHAELAQSLLTNSNRLARTTMTLDAVLSEGGAAARESVAALIEQGAASLKQISETVASETLADCASPRLRATQRDLARRLGAREDGGIGGELATLSDRLVDNINTLAHVVARAGRTPD